MTAGSLCENVKCREHSQDIELDGRVILKWSYRNNMAKHTEDSS